MIRVAAIGTASTGKSAVLNAVFGTGFLVDPRARSTTSAMHAVVLFDSVEIEVVDTPPISDVKADVYLLVCDKDLTDSEYRAALWITRERRPIAVVLNKADTFEESQLEKLLRHIRERMQGVLPPERVIACAADPVRLVYRQRSDGSITEHMVSNVSDVILLEAVIREMIREAEATLRVRTREFATRAAVKISTLWKDRLR